MAMDAQESQEFYEIGRRIITDLAQSADKKTAYSRTFEVRGGALGMEENGDTTGIFIEFFNNLRDFLASNNGWNQRVLDEYRTDY